MAYITRPAPHVRHNDNIKISMADVLVALLPCAAMGTIYAGLRFVIIMGISVFTAVLFELVISLITRRQQTVGDLSAVVTGVIIAMLLPVTVPLWYPAFGALFAVIIAKWLFGGVGKNIFNPALSGVAALTMTNPAVMSRFSAPFTSLPLWQTPSQQNFTPVASVLSQLKEKTIPTDDIVNILIGNTPGFAGTVCILVVLASALYLFYRRTISIHIPAGILITVALLAICFPRTNELSTSLAFELMAGPLFFCTVFCATDPVSTPNSASGKIFFGIGIGLITMLIRYLGTMNDGIVFAILMMNALSFAMDKLIWRLRPKGGAV